MRARLARRHWKGNSLFRAFRGRRQHRKGRMMAPQALRPAEDESGDPCRPRVRVAGGRFHDVSSKTFSRAKGRFRSMRISHVRRVPPRAFEIWSNRESLTPKFPRKPSFINVRERSRTRRSGDICPTNLLTVEFCTSIPVSWAAGLRSGRRRYALVAFARNVAPRARTLSFHRCAK